MKIRALRAEAAARSQPARSGRVGHPDRGNGLAFKTEDMPMWFLPISISLSMAKTRMGWSVRIRVYVLF